MKKFVIGAAILSFSLTIQAQSNKVISAYNYLKNNSFIKAKEAIDLAAQHPKTQNAPKTHFYRGRVYYSLATSPDEKHKDFKGKESLLVAAESFHKAKTLEGKKRFNERDLMAQYNQVAAAIFQVGVEAYNAKDYPTASSMFEKSANIKEKDFGTIDTLAFYNTALAADLGKDPDRAITFYTKCKDLGYKPSRMYYNISKQYLNKSENDKAIEILNEGLQKFPGEQALLTTAINIYLQADKVDDALAYLGQAIENEPGNASYYFARGTLFDKKADIDNAAKDYLQAIEIKPDHFDANYNLGALYVNESGKVQETINNLPRNATDKEYNDLVAKRDGYFTKAVPYLEKAHNINQEDKVVMQTLMQLYVKTKQNEKYKEMKSKMGQ